MSPHGRVPHLSPVMKTYSPDEAYARLAAACARREQAPRDVLLKLERMGLAPAEAGGILRRLEAEGFVDEHRYARAFVHDKTLYDHWGRLKTRHALTQHGISQAAASEALAGIDNEAYAEGLRALLAAKERSLRESDARLRRLKLMRYAAGRGYEADEIARCLPYND